MVDFKAIDGLKQVLGYQDDIANQRNPNAVTAAQLGAYDKATIDAMLALKVGSGMLPFSQFGDLSFIPPNISSRYEGATPTNAAVVFQVEGDGSRNFLRNGTDGQATGVYLCKLVTDANDNLMGYTPMATPWAPACLPAGDVVQSVFASAPGQVSLLCYGTAGGRLNSAATYSLITNHPDTLNPDMHTDGFFGGLSEAIWDVSTSLYFREGANAYHVKVVNESSGPQVRIDQLGNLSTGTTSARLTNWNGNDLLGNAGSTWTGLQCAPTLVGGLGSGNAYCERPVGAGAGAWQTAPSCNLYNNGDGTWRLFFYHETWVGLGSGQDRKMIARSADFNLSAKTFTWQANCTGAVKATGNTTSIIISGQMAYSSELLGWPVMGNYNNCMSRCRRSGEVFAFSAQTAYGNASGAWSPNMTLAQYLSPPSRVDGRSVLVYTPNYPSVVGASLHNVSLTPSGHLNLRSTQGTCLVKSPKFAAPIPYTYPDGSTGTWAVDSGRESVAQTDRTQIGVVMTKAGVITNCGTATRSRLSTYYRYDDNGQPIVASGQLTVQAGVFDQVETWVTAQLGSLSLQEMYTQLYFPQLGSPMNGCCIGVTTILDTSGQGYSFIGIYPMTITNAVLTTISGLAGRLSAVVASTVIRTGIPSAETMPLYVGEMDDYTFIGGGGPRNFIYTGNAGYPMQAVGMTASGLFSIRDYQGHDYADNAAMFCLPSLGVVEQWSSKDAPFAQTMLTVNSYGRTRASLASVASRMVIASQAVYGSWNLYFAEEIYCQIGGVFGTLPKRTVDLSTIKANPANTTFYIYAQLTGQTMDYVISASALSADRTRIYCGTATTDASHVSSVNVAKVFSIDGFSLSETQIANAIPASVGSPAGAGIINWPTL